MSGGPFEALEQHTKWSVNAENSRDPQLYAIVFAGHAVGLATYLRIEATHGVVEIGHVSYYPRLAKTRAATDAMYLLATMPSRSATDVTSGSATATIRHLVLPLPDSALRTFHRLQGSQSRHNVVVSHRQ